MPIDIARYHGWNGPRRSPWLASMAIVRTGLVQVFRRKAYWVVLLLALTRFLLFWSIIYGVTQAQLPQRMRQGLLERLNFSAQPQPGQTDGYVLFMAGQGIVVMMLLAFTGSLLVGGDFRQGALPFYLSRRIERRHYIVGKLAAVATIVTLMTTLPALALFVEYGMFTTSTLYWLENWRVVAGVLVYGGVMALVLSSLLVSLSAWLQRTAPIVVAWSSLFVLLRGMRLVLAGKDAPYWNLIDLWQDMHVVGRLAFDKIPNESDRRVAYWAVAVLAGVCAVSLSALVHRVRAVEIVK
jgi:hypothetical protein